MSGDPREQGDGTQSGAQPQGLDEAPGCEDWTARAMAEEKLWNRKLKRLEQSPAALGFEKLSDLTLESLPYIHRNGCPICVGIHF